MTHEFPRQPHETTENLINKLLAVTRNVVAEPIDPDFSIVVDDVPGSPVMEEFRADNLGGRFIATESDSEVADQHALLLEVGLPVMSSIYMPSGIMLMHVPEGTRPLAGYVNSMHRQPGAFCGVFEEMGLACGELERRNLGNVEPSAEYPILNQFALAADEEAPSGGRVIMTPPYQLSERSKEVVLADVTKELTALNALTPDQAIYLVNCMEEGWSAEELSHEI